MPCRWIRWTNVEFISARLAGKCAFQQMPAIRGRRLCGICRRCFRWRHKSFEKGAAMIRVVLPPHLRGLARVKGEVTLDVAGTVSILSVLDALEAKYPMLEGTIRDHGTRQRRPFLRFFACAEDWSHDPLDKPLPEVVAQGKEPLLVVGAIAGG